jgi:SAM-dependent methyltransferase
MPDIGIVATFDKIYSHNRWGFGSGHGSLPKVTEGYRRFVQDFIREHRVQTVVDFGCGDWQISRLMDWAGVEYLGLDVAQSVIENNRATYGGQNVRFELAPDHFNDVPTADLLIVKDVLQHLPDEMIHRFMAQVVRRFRFALITNCIEPASARNRDIQAGEFRPLDMRAAPFNYPAEAVFAFSGKAKFSLRAPFTKFPAWHKVVLLYSQL